MRDEAKQGGPLVSDTGLLVVGRGGVKALDAEEVFAHAAPNAVGVALRVVGGGDQVDHRREDGLHHGLEFASGLVHGFHEVEKDIVRALVARGGLSGVLVIERVHTVDVVRLGGTAVVVGDEDGVHIILVQLKQVALLGHAVNGH